LIEPNAIDVCIAGTFNEWKADATPMLLLGNGRWAKELSLPAGCYEYRFVVDGQWVDDPAAKESVTNPFGGVNAILEIRASDPPLPTPKKEKSNQVTTENRHRN